MNKPVLVIMAAGMGSRYGGLKQIDTVDDENDLGYSISYLLKSLLLLVLSKLDIVKLEDSTISFKLYLISFLFLLLSFE